MALLFGLFGLFITIPLHLIFAAIVMRNDDKKISPTRDAIEKWWRNSEKEEEKNRLHEIDKNNKKIQESKLEKEQNRKEKSEKTDNAQTLENISFFVIIVFLIASVCFVLFFM